MSRITVPGTIAEAPKQSQALLEEIQQSLGTVPNLFRIIANSPAALEGYLTLNNVLATGVLHPATRERIALAVAEIDDCRYCLAAHTYLGQNVAQLTGNEINKNRLGVSTDVKADAAVRFAADIARNRGAVSVDAVDDVRAVGYSDAEIVEIITHVALNTLTNYINNTLDTEVDFPLVDVLTG